MRVLVKGRGRGLRLPRSKCNAGTLEGPGEEGPESWGAEFRSSRLLLGWGRTPAPTEGTDVQAGRRHACGGLNRQQKPLSCLQLRVSVKLLGRRRKALEAGARPRRRRWVD